MIRNVTESQKKRVAGRQRFKCAASIPDYTCPLKGEPFDESGYEIDHIKELRDGGSNDLENLQALCIMCHRVKTVRMTSAMSKKDTPKIEIHTCYHCSKHSATVFENEKWHCEADCNRECDGTPNDGCGPRSSPNPPVFAQKLDRFRRIPRTDPPGFIRKEWVRPNGQVVYMMENRR